jgi:CDP-diacylglycerol--glycerol-3-phosphate 3-phosphatidyltransferase
MRDLLHAQMSDIADIPLNPLHDPIHTARSFFIFPVASGILAKFKIPACARRKDVMISKIGRQLLASPLYHIAGLLYRAGFTPNAISIIGFLITAVSALLLAMGYLFWGGVVLLIGASFDMLDGSLARYIGQESKFGAFLDSTLDRYAESVTLLGLATFYAGGQDPLLLFLIITTLIGSWMVSYTRARAEGLQVECKVGLLQRPERILLLGLGLLTGWLLPVFVILALLTNITALQRVYEVYQRTRPTA